MDLGIKDQTALMITGAQDLPTGSGVVEATCRTLATQRLMRSGRRRRHEGGQMILTFRAPAQSVRLTGHGTCYRQRTVTQFMLATTSFSFLENRRRDASIANLNCAWTKLGTRVSGRNRRTR